MLMDEVLKERFGTPILEGKTFKNIIQSDLYDKTYLKAQLIKMTKQHERYKDLLVALKQQLTKVNELVINKNTKQGSLMYQKLDRLILELEANDFARVFSLPMNRVEHELLSMNVRRLKTEKNELKKIGELIAYVNAFINLLYGDSQLNQQMIQILTESINLGFSEDSEDIIQR